MNSKTALCCASVRTLRALAFLTTCALAVPTLAGPVTLTLIAASGQPAPGLTNVTFDAVTDPRVDDFGRCTFWARLAGTGVTTTNETSFWSNKTGSLALVLRKDTPVPGTGDVFVGLSTPALTADGQLALTASVGSGASSFPTTLAQFLLVGPTFTQLYRESASVPVITPLALNDTAAITFKSGDGAAIFSSRTGPVTTLTKLNDPAPGAGTPGAVFLLLGVPAHDYSGATIFWAGDGPLAGAVNEYGIWTDLGGLHAIALTGKQAPGLPNGVVFAELDTTPRINSAGDIAFWARLSGPGVNATNDGSLWRVTAGSVALLIRENSPAPGVPGATIGTLARHLELADSGRIVFTGTLAGAQIGPFINSAIWSSSPTSGLDLLVLEGNPVPGLGPDVQFAVLGRPSLTTTGRLAFLAGLRGPGVTQTTSSALIASDGLGTLRVIARAGDPFTVAQGDTRTIARVVFDQGAEETGSTQYSSSGTLVCTLLFTNGTSAVVSAKIALCSADFNADGFANGDDFDLFAAAFQAGDISADINGDGFVNGPDFDEFYDAFFVGC